MATKLYSTELRSTYLSDAAREAVGGSGSRGQGHLYVTAASKNDAHVLIEAAGCRTTKSTLTLIRDDDHNIGGRDLQALRDAGLFDESAIVIAMPSQGRGVARFEGQHGWQALGEVTTGGDFVSGEMLQTLEQAIEAVEKSIGPVPHGLDHELALVLDAARARLESLRNARKTSAW